MKSRLHAPQRHRRRAVTLVLCVLLIVVVLGMVACGLDIGYIVLVRTQLQAAADSSAMAAAASTGLPRDGMEAVARQYAAYHDAGSPGRKIQLRSQDIEYGTWDVAVRRFAPSPTPGNAVRVTTRADEFANGQTPLFFGKIFNQMSFSEKTSAVAMANPRDIAFVVDLSGSMNDDTEPCWATDTIDSTYTASGYSSVGSSLMQQVYDDFHFGPYPGALEYIGRPLGAPQNQYAYAELTKDGGPLSGGAIASKYRIGNNDNEATRKQKGYSWIIDYQIARIMPNAKPAPSSSSNFAYWAAYLDYLITAVTIVPPSPPSGGGGGGGGGGGSGGGGGGSSGPKPPIGRLLPARLAPWYAAWLADPRHRQLLQPAGEPSDHQLAIRPGAWEGVLLPQLLLGAGLGTPPADRGTIPPNRYSGRIDKFNNPNTSTFPSVSISVPRGFRNKIGYRTYVQFLMDHGRDLQPANGQYAALSRYHLNCPWHPEDTAGGTFSFPPREQPTHAARRAMIAAMQVVKQRNASIVNLNQCDWVSIITFDSLSGGGPAVAQPLTADYDQAMRACTGLQACGDTAATTATEAGLIAAKRQLQPPSSGGRGRLSTNKVVVLLTDGVPNLYVSNAADIDNYIRQSTSHDFYSDGQYWKDAPLMQCLEMKANHWYVYPVGIGLGCDYDFMDRLARSGGTADDRGQSLRGSGNPAQYEQRLTEIFEQIITNPKIRLVQ